MTTTAAIVIFASATCLAACPIERSTMTTTPQTEAVSDFMDRHFAHLRHGRKEYTEAEVRSIMLAFEAGLSHLVAENSDLRERNAALGNAKEIALDTATEHALRADELRDRLAAAEAERDQLREAIKKQANAAELSRKNAFEMARGLVDEDIRCEGERAKDEAKSVAEANAILTAENDQLRAQVERLQGGEPAQPVIPDKVWADIAAACDVIGQTGQGAEQLGYALDRLSAAVMGEICLTQPQVQELPDPTLSALMGQDVTREQWDRFKLWAREAELAEPRDDASTLPADYVAALERFSQLARADERERCAKVCDAIEEKYQTAESTKWPEMKTDAQTGAGDCAAAIRSRKDEE